MNKTFGIIIVLSLFVWNVSAQFYYGDLYIETQAELDEIASHGYHGIDGSLIIGGRYWDNLSDIHDLSGLMTLRIIDGALTIQNNPWLKSLHGLDSLWYVDFCIDIYNNDSLTNLEGLENIVLYETSPVLPSGKNIIIGGNQQLISLDGLPANVDELDDLRIFGNDNLTDISTLSNLYRILVVDISTNASLQFIDDTAFGALDSVHVIEIYGNERLERIGGFEQLRFLRNRFEITNNPSLEVISGFDGIHKTQTIIIDNNTNLRAVTGFSNLDTILGVTLKNNDNLMVINNLFNHPEHIKSVKIINNDRLKSFGPFPHLYAGATYNIEINDNDSLTSVVGLTGLKRIGAHLGAGRLELEENPLLSSLEGLDSLKFVGDGFSLENTSVTSLLPLSNLDTLGNYMKIRDYSGYIKTLDGVQNIKYVGGMSFLADSLSDISAITDHSFYLESLRFSECNSLDSIDGFSQIVPGSFSWGLHVWDNRSLKKIAGFDMVSSMEYLRIVDNPSLQIISGFANLSLLGNGWGNYLYDNPSLQDASGLCHLFTQGEMEREMEIHDNAPGFNSKNEIIQWCILPTEDITPLSDAIRLYPNPVVDEFTVDLPEELLSNSTIVQLVDFSGRIMMDKEIHRSVTTLSVTNITGGLYLLKVLDDGKMVAARKLMIINNQ